MFRGGVAHYLTRRYVANGVHTWEERLHLKN